MPSRLSSTAPCLRTRCSSSSSVSLAPKVEALENALTFLHDNLVVKHSTSQRSILVLSPSDVKEATQPIAQAAVGSGNGDSNGLVGKLIARYIESLKKERIMFLIFIGLWFIVVFMGLCIIWWHSYGRRLFLSKETRRRRQQQGSIDTFVVPDKQVDDPRMNEKDIGLLGDSQRIPPPLSVTKCSIHEYQSPFSCCKTGAT